MASPSQARVRARSLRTRGAIIAAFLLLGAQACSGNMWGDDDGGTGGDGSGGDGGGDGSPTGCVDEDGDGYGERCDAGPDCDDEDPSRNTGCTVVSIGGEDGDNPFDPRDDNSSGVRLDEDGYLTLESHPELEPAVWVANSDEGTVSRLDSRTGREIGRYPSVLEATSTARPWNEACNGTNAGNCPSRTAIDFRGDCWVANRAFGSQGTVTKIAAHEEDCIDRNGDGDIQTSRDIDGDGRIDLASEEFLGQEDECVLFTVDVGDVDGTPRALAIAPDASGASSGGNAWVGLNLERRAAELDGDTGTIRRYVDLPLNPYGALASKYEGRVWFVNAGWQRDLPDNPPGITSVDFRTAEVSPRYDVEANAEGCIDSYGLAIDAEGRVWVGGRTCTGAFRYDPSVGEWLGIIDDAGRTRGLVADAEGNIWCAHSADCGADHCGVVSRFRGEDGGDLELFYLPDGSGTIGVDLDVDGRIWVVNRSTDSASRIDPTTGGIEEFPVGRGPYTYSDFTGHSLLLQFPRGYYRDVVEACAEASWLVVRWDAHVPPDTRIEVRVRTAEERIDLAAAPWIGPFLTSPADLQSPPGPVQPGRFLEIEVTLISLSELSVPSISSLDVTYECPVS